MDERLIFTEPEVKDISFSSTQAKKIVDILDKTVNEENENAEGLAASRQEIKQSFEHFPEILSSFAELFRAKLKLLNIDTGKMKIYLVGGRAIGKPLKANSDIDLVIAFDKPPSPYTKGRTLGISSQDWTAMRKQLILEEFPKVCEHYGIPNYGQYPGRFQILSWGEKTPAEVESGIKEHGAAILVFEEL